MLQIKTNYITFGKYQMLRNCSTLAYFFRSPSSGTQQTLNLYKIFSQSLLVATEVTNLLPVSGTENFNFPESFLLDAGLDNSEYQLEEGAGIYNVGSLQGLGIVPCKTQSARQSQKS